MSVPRVSVVMAAYNPGSYLAAAVQSILNQEFQDFELLVLDDGSTDDSTERLDQLSDSRVKIVRNPKNLGIIRTRNRLLDLCRAPLMAVLDSDDIAYPHRLLMQVSALERDPDLCLLGSCADLIDEDGVRFGGIDTGVYEDHEIRRVLFTSNRFVQSSIMLRTDVARSLGGYPTQFPVAEDYALWLRIAANYKVGNLRDVLVQYRVHGAQVSQRKIRYMREMTKRVQYSSWTELASARGFQDSPAPCAPNLWSRLRARPGTLGGDYLEWARLYRRMGNNRAAIQTAINGLMNAPLGIELFRVCLPYRFGGTA